jgi:hypothetical protein
LTKHSSVIHNAAFKDPYIQQLPYGNNLRLIQLSVWEYGNLWAVMRAGGLGLWNLIQLTISLEMHVPSQGHYGFHSFPLLTDFVCLYTYEFWLSLCKIVKYVDRFIMNQDCDGRHSELVDRYEISISEMI